MVAKTPTSAKSSRGRAPDYLTATKTGAGWTNLEESFRERLQALIDASGGRITFVSGWRSEERQAQLFAAAVKKYGSEKAARKWVAPPGKSHHNHGLAADLGGDLKLLKRLAPAYGLRLPMPWEPWHIEPTEQAENADAQTTAPDDHQPADKFTSNAQHLASLFGVDIELPEAAPEHLNIGQQHPEGGRTQTMLAALKQAGFSGEGLRIGLAVGLAEGSNTGARNTNKDKYRSVDRGWWQWNSKWHPEVSDEEADDPFASARHLFRVTNGGKDWNQWSTFKNGRYKNYLGEVA